MPEICCNSKLLGTAICHTRPFLRQQCSAVREKMRVPALFAHSCASLAQMLHPRCTVRVHQVREQRNLPQPIGKCGTAQSTGCVQSTLHMYRILSLHAPVHCELTVYNAIALNGARFMCIVCCKCNHRGTVIVRLYLDRVLKGGIISLLLPNLMTERCSIN